jgi:predicted permease
MESLWKDISFGLRMLIRRPAFTAIAVLTLALGIGANTAIFTLFDSVLLESLPVREPARLVLFSPDVGEGTSDGSLPNAAWNLFTNESYEFLKKQPLPFESLTAFRSGEDPVTVHFSGESDSGPLQRANVHLVSGNYFEVLGVSAAMGRNLRPDDDKPNANPVTVVSNGYWKQHLHSDPNVIGKLAILNGTAFKIIGLAPPEFFGERVRRPPDYWLPLNFQPQIEQRASFLDRTDTYWLSLMARLRPGVTREQAQEAGTIALQQLLTSKAGSQATPESKASLAKNKIRLFDGAAGISGLRFVYSEPLHILLVVVALVLLIACANVGNLLLARAVARSTEVTLRLALGASRGRLIRQLLTESVMLAVIGAAFGILLAHWAVQVLVKFLAGTSPLHTSLNLPILAFTVGITLVAGIIFGIAPALQAGRTDLVTALKMGSSRVAGGGRKFGTTQGLVVGQIAMSLVLLVGATLFARSLLNLENQPLGFNQENVVLARINPRLAGYKPAEVGALYRKIYDRLHALPGVQAATIASYSPLGRSNSTSTLSVQGYEAKQNENTGAQTVFVGPDYPHALGMQLLLGREITLQDTVGAAKVAMVNEAFVRHFFPNQDPIGHRFGFGDEKSSGDYEIIGVLKDAHFAGADEKKVQETVFPPLLQEQSQAALNAEVEVRTVGDPAAATAAIRASISQEDSRLPITGVQSLHEQVAGTFKQQQLAARLVSFFGGLALLLACVGLYGVVSQGIARRTNEIGVRMALGAQRGNILWMVLRDTLLLLLFGLAIGIPAAFGASHFISSQLYGVRSTDILSFSLGIVVLAAVSIVAGYLPARRASKVDPIVALRYE